MERERTDIAVLGAGPAGTAAALGLAALGYAVVAVAAPPARARAPRESFSARVVAALRQLGVERALAAVEPPGERAVRWAGDARTLSGESQVERRAFDAGLLADLAARGVRVLRDEVTSTAADEAGVQIALRSGARIDARFAVEARGRAAPAGGTRTRGPETVCVVQRWRGRSPSGSPRIAICSLESGWAWLADDGRGALATQLALDAHDAPARDELAARTERTLRADEHCSAWLRDAAPEGVPFARAAAAVLESTPLSGDVLRVGDAAHAVDPLSGNGVFQALSSGLTAPAVVNTLLRKPERGALARRFVESRARDVFLRFAQVSRGFYALGAAHHGGTFWEERAAWPGGEAPRNDTPEIALRPVLCDGWIEEREVVLTAERPLGTWHVAGAELAPLVRTLAAAERSGGREGREAELTRALAALPEAARPHVGAWLRAHGLA